MGTVWVPMTIYEDKCKPDWFDTDEHVENILNCHFDCDQCSSNYQRVKSAAEMGSHLRKVLGELGERGLEDFLKPMTKALREVRPEKHLLNVMEAITMVEACIRRS